MVDIRSGLRPGDIGRVSYLHGTLYAAEFGWDHTFEAYVARPLADFALRRNPRERIWLVEAEGRVEGCIAIVAADEAAAQLRWFLLHPRLRGQGLGRKMLAQALEFCRGAGYRSVFLWTVRGLEAAAALYRQAGFQLTEETTHPMWGRVVCEQRCDLVL
ncbi:MAG: GNAT family N-acetyltransferase [Thermodesulfobacteriota bacterium]